MQKIYQAAIYLRLSREDGDVTEGSKQVRNSIANQNELVMDYLKSHPEIQVASTYVDDGYSGVDFERPEFQRMLSDIRENKINCVVVKDLSRFGRNYIESGRYIEKIFPMLGIRFIAITDGYDSINEDMGSEMIIPFKNLINDAYCRDISVKIRSHMDIKRRNGEYIGAFAAYGYLKDEENKNHLVINKQKEFAGCNVIERCDDGISGRYFDTRPQFTEMIELAKKGKINCIIVKDCSRFGRDYVELGDYLEQLFPFLGVRFIAINDHYDSDKTEGGLDIAFKNLVYDIYSRDLSKKVRASRKQMAAQGKYIAGQTLYGYRKKKKNKHQLEIDPEAAAIVREIFDMRIAGVGLTEIARNLNDRGIKCPSVYKTEKGEASNHTENAENMCWTASGVLQLLNNEIYTGAVVALKSTFDTVTGKLKVKPKEEWSKVEGMHEAIVSKEIFQKAQDMIVPQKSPSETRKQHYVCGCCGRGLNRRNGTDLYCARGYFLEDDCECRVVKAKEPTLDEIVLKELKAKLLRVMDAEELRLEAKSGAPSMASNLESLKGALESVKKAKQMLFEKLADRSIDRETFKEKKVQYDSEIAELEQRISDASLAESLSVESDEKMDEVKSFLEVAALTDDMWEKFIQDVIVYPGGRLEIHWNFEEEF